jgi:hypothetical protein
VLEKKEAERLLDTVEADGSSPSGPTIQPIDFVRLSAIIRNLVRPLKSRGRHDVDGYIFKVAVWSSGSRRPRDQLTGSMRFILFPLETYSASGKPCVNRGVIAFG